MNRFLIAIVLAVGCHHASAGPTCLPKPDFSGAKDTTQPAGWDETTVPAPPNKHAGYIVIDNGAGDYEAYLADPDNAVVTWSATVKGSDLGKFVDDVNSLAGQVDVIRKPPPPPPIIDQGRMALTLQYYIAQGIQAAGF